MEEIWKCGRYNKVCIHLFWCTFWNCKLWNDRKKGGNITYFVKVYIWKRCINKNKCVKVEWKQTQHTWSSWHICRVERWGDCNVPQNNTLNINVIFPLCFPPYEVWMVAIFITSSRCAFFFCRSLSAPDPAVYLDESSRHSLADFLKIWLKFVWIHFWILWILTYNRPIKISNSNAQKISVNIDWTVVVFCSLW